MSDRIVLADMVFLGRHGAGDEERAEPQDIEVDVELELDLAGPGKSDDLSDTVDYRGVFDACREVVEERSFHLLEGIAEAIAAVVLSRSTTIKATTVRVRKPGVRLDGRLDHAGVSIERRRAAGERD
jgi:dihydroneopterin aldolase